MFNIFRDLRVVFGGKKVIKPTKLDEFGEDSYSLDVAILTVAGICKKYDEKGMHSMAREIHRQVGEKILQRGLRRWQV